MEVAEITIYKVIWGKLRTETIATYSDEIDKWLAVWPAAGWHKSEADAWSRYNSPP